MKLISLLLFLTAESAFCGEIALTFDDAPMPATGVMSGPAKTQRLIEQLAEADAPPVVFFVTTKHVNEQSKARLNDYAAAGHYLANHSHEHPSANEMTADEFLLDAYRAHLALKRFDRVVPLFRFPYLHHGKDPSTRATIAAGLAELKYDIGYVTVDNFDWYIDSLYREAVKNGDKVNQENLGKLYVDTLWQAITFYDKLAIKTLGRSPKHVLLLHENDMAAAYVGDLIKHIRAQGWEVISPIDAYKDPIANVSKDLTYTKQGRVAALAHEKGASVDTLRHKSENTEYIDRLFREYKVIEAQRD